MRSRRQRYTGQITMETSNNLILIGLFGYAWCQGLMNFFDSPADVKPMPEKCRLNDLMGLQCCVLPPFFSREVARECGAQLGLRQVHQESAVATLRRQILTGCDYWTCVLSKYGMLSGTELADDDQYLRHLDRWVDLNPAFAEAALNAKVHCKLSFRVQLPLAVCEFYGFNYCIRNFIKLNCPIIIPIPECEEQKKFFEDCKEYYY